MVARHPSPSACLRPPATAAPPPTPDQICPDPVLNPLLLIYNFYTLSRPWRFPLPQVSRGGGCF